MLKIRLYYQKSLLKLIFRTYIFDLSIKFIFQIKQKFLAFEICLKHFIINRFHINCNSNLLIIKYNIQFNFRYINTYCIDFLYIFRHNTFFVNA